MKRIWSLMLIAAITITACSKDEPKLECPTINVTAPATEVANLKAYLDANNITATADPRGFFYIINRPGSAQRPTVCNYVSVAYEGKLTTGQTFDSSPNAAFPLSGVIPGWQEAVPLIGAGGSMVLYLPPSLAYPNGTTGIPANSNLIFTIDLHSFQ
jgi:FKBP-type peptidyl-prolyl cis-trans isomerase FkpA